MGEDLAQAEKLQDLGSGTWQEKPASPSLASSSTPSPSLNLGSTEEALRDSAQVNAVTVLTLLDKLVHMLDAVQENQHHMEQRQISLEGSVKGIQNDLTKLSKYQASTGNTVSKLLEKSRKVSAHTRAVKERMDLQSAQVRRLEANHAQLLRRNHFKVLIFQVSVPHPPPLPTQLGSLRPRDLSPPGPPGCLYICPACRGPHTRSIVPVRPQQEAAESARGATSQVTAASTHGGCPGSAGQGRPLGSTWRQSAGWAGEQVHAPRSRSFVSLRSDCSC